MKNKFIKFRNLQDSVLWLTSPGLCFRFEIRSVGLNYEVRNSRKRGDGWRWLRIRTNTPSQETTVYNQRAFRVISYNLFCCHAMRCHVTLHFWAEGALKSPGNFLEVHSDTGEEKIPILGKQKICTRTKSNGHVTEDNLAKWLLVFLVPLWSHGSPTIVVVQFIISYWA